MSPEIEFYVGACRILYNYPTISPNWRPIVEEIIDPKMYFAIRGWKDLGATKSGFSIEDSLYIRTNLAELGSKRLEKIKKINPTNFQLAFLFMNKDGSIGLRHFREVWIDSYGNYKRDECSGFPIRFRIVRD